MYVHRPTHPRSCCPDETADLMMLCEACCGSAPQHLRLGRVRRLLAAKHLSSFQRCLPLHILSFQAPLLARQSNLHELPTFRSHEHHIDLVYSTSRQGCFRLSFLSPTYVHHAVDVFCSLRFSSRSTACSRPSSADVAAVNALSSPSLVPSTRYSPRDHSHIDSSLAPLGTAFL